MLSLFFLSSGLFLGWSLGANDAANIFGTAVGSRMLRFKTAAYLCACFVVLGAGFSGSGTTRTLGELGKVNELAGAFMVALAAALTVYWMTKLHIPVSTSQAIVGAIVGWNFFTGSLTDMNSLLKIVGSWIVSPVLAGLIALVMYRGSRFLMKKLRIHMLVLDTYTRVGFIMAAAFGAYSLGANNIANVMGVFVPVSPFEPIQLGSYIITPAEQLFILGGLAIAMGIVTYSERVIKTVGSNLVRLTPMAGMVVAFSTAIVLFVFASRRLESLFLGLGLPPIPLVPISSSQVVVGAVVGIGIASGGRGINYRVLGRIASGWVSTPVIACVITFISLFFLQNVFNQPVYKPVLYKMDFDVFAELEIQGVQTGEFADFKDRNFNSAAEFKDTLWSAVPEISSSELKKVIDSARIYNLTVDLSQIEKGLLQEWFSPEQVQALKVLEGEKYDRNWKLYNDLSSRSVSWQLKESLPENIPYNREIQIRLDYLKTVFQRDNNQGKGR